ncbi:hypothetical protein CH375_02665 [Leptospira ellisii]|uniref:Uncharacterized protein n=1 Tax=Leptospira ellisii TaxID=2023197 RepID=A0A2N0BPG1_9LEPT|nr:hypothetical protein CH379_08220 [Leptospira ellisii]PKA05876.1 hypothetical protein CH375_02665 [Leptospira ellisii]
MRELPSGSAGFPLQTRNSFLFFDSFVPLAIVYRISVRVNRIFSNVRGVMPDDTNSEFHKILNYFPAGFENFFRSLCPI